MTKAGDLLSHFLDPQMINTAEEYTRLFNSWTSIVEHYKIAALAAHSRIVEFERHVLLIETDHPGWIQILQTKQRQLLSEFQYRFPDLAITGISFRLSRDPLPINTAAPPKAEVTAVEAIPETTQTALVHSEKNEEPWNQDFYEKTGDDDFIKALKRLEQGIITRKHTLHQT
ncbi:MAG: DUF721 domain-containing protein [Treponema sp.]|jgi:hypothetical protein|nr:DUF721 domain-containing protein [Treponema sp.]